MVNISSSQASAPRSQDAAENTSSKYTPTPWRVFTNDDGTKLVGIGSGEGQGILDCGFGVWAWDDAEGIANANLVVKAVNRDHHFDALVKALKSLTNEMSGIWEVFEYGLRNEISNTNYAVAREKIVEAEQVLAAVGRETV